MELKGTYAIDKSWSMTVGYLYEDFDLSDDQWTGYVLDPSGATLSGAYDDPDFDGHTVYVSARYAF